MPTLTAAEPKPAKTAHKYPDPVWSNLFVRLNLATADLRRKVEALGSQTDPDSLARHIVSVLKRGKPNMEEINLCLLILKEKMTEPVSQKLWKELWDILVAHIRANNNHQFLLLAHIPNDEDPVED